MTVAWFPIVCGRRCLYASPSRAERGEVASIPPRRRAAGFTLVEMIAVLAIMLILVAVAVPTFARLGVFSRDNVSATARTVFDMLRAARVQAATFHRDTAVFYVLSRAEDSRNPDPVAFDLPPLIVDGIGMARQMTKEEFESYIGPFVRDRWLRSFIMLESAEGKIQMFSRVRRHRYTCIPARVDIDGKASEGDWEEQLLGINDGKSKQGLYFIDLYRQTAAGGVEAVSPFKNLEDPDDLLAGFPDREPGQFPAHVFRPSGDMRHSGSTQVRFEVSVTPSPDARLNDRFMDSDAPVPIEEVAPTVIQLNSFTGRAKLGVTG